VDFQVVTVKTLGDTLPPESRGETDGKGAFTEDIESRLLRGDVDIAVHSLKDMSAVIPRGLRLGATPPRADPRDALVSAEGLRLQDVRKGGRIGTSSSRRRVQLLRLRPDLEVVEIHGNVETRIGKVGASGLDGIVLASAGLDRLSLGERTSQRFTTEEIVPAAGQGTIAVEVREGDSWTERLVTAINDGETMRASECERAFIRAVGGDCSFPVGAYASASGIRAVTITGMIASPEGDGYLKREMTSEDPLSLGRYLAEEMLRMGGTEMLRSSSA
jgi:hydroxymethylbilane synthase